MSTMPPDQPTQPTTTTGSTTSTGLGDRLGGAGSNMPSLPGGFNSELVVFLLVWVLMVILWAWKDEIGPGEFATFTVALTFAYLISRGIAKASRVYEDGGTRR